MTFEWARQQNVNGAARAEQVKATSKSELSMLTFQKLVCNLDYSGAKSTVVPNLRQHLKFTLVVGL
jgi:hypothetical protein